MVVCAEYYDIVNVGSFHIQCGRRFLFLYVSLASGTKASI